MQYPKESTYVFYAGASGSIKARWPTSSTEEGVVSEKTKLTSLVFVGTNTVEGWRTDFVSEA